MWTEYIHTLREVESPVHNESRCKKSLSFLLFHRSATSIDLLYTKPLDTFKLSLEMLDMIARKFPSPHKTLKTFHNSWKIQEQHLNYKRDIWHPVHFIFQSYTLQPVLEFFDVQTFSSSWSQFSRTSEQTTAADCKWATPAFRFDFLPSFELWFRLSFWRNVLDHNPYSRPGFSNFQQR